MIKQLIRTETKDCIYYEAVFSWGSIFAFTMVQMMKELEEMGIKYNLN